ncbi:hypothetical protein ABIF63_007686 [Bradyrhizobium japonicum]|uniref:HPt domain-containing protein n=1 Tax=Bradyrhizobium japonicum TaxID=375 RepID=A0ABV2S4Y0_BRAJP
MNLDDGLERFHAHLVEDHVAQNAGIVDDAVELAEMIGRGLHDLAGGDSLRHRLEIGHRDAAALLDLVDHLLGGRSAGTGAVGGNTGVVDDDLGALRRAEQRDLPPDAAACAGDDDDLVLQ